MFFSNVVRLAFPSSSVLSLSKASRRAFSSSSSSCTPDSTTRLRLTKKQCVSLVRACKSMGQLKQIHCQIIMSNLHQNRDVMDDLLVFSTDPEAGDLSYALKVFDSMNDRSLFMYNLMIKAFAKRGSWKNAVLLFDRMREERLSPDNFTYPFVLKALGCLRAMPEGRKIHGFIIKTGSEFDPYVRNSIMGMYAEMDIVKASKSLFDEMPKRDLISWNVLIAGYVKCAKFEEAISVFTRMEDESVKPDEVTLVSTLSACASLRKLEVGKKVHRYMNEGLKFSMPLGNALLDMYAKCGRLDMAQTFFDNMPAKNVISWTTIVSAYVSAGQLDKARELFDCSPLKDVILWTAMINGYVQYSHFDEALGIFREMQTKGIKPDKFTVVSLLTVCANWGAMEQGQWIHRYIEDNMIKIDAVVGTALIDMYAKCGFIDESLEVFHRVDGKDTATWTSIICGLAMNGQTSKALELFSEMKRIGAKPDDITFIGVLSACSHGGLVDEGRRHFYAMREMHRVEPKLEHYGCLVDLLGRAGLLSEAEDLIQSIPCTNDEEVLPLWGALLGACRVHNNVEMGERVAKQFMKQETGNSGIHTAVANIYAAADRWEDVTRVRRRMRDLGIKKTPGCSSIEVNGVIHEFLVGDTSHPETNKICSLLDPMSLMLELDERTDMDNRLIEMVS